MTRGEHLALCKRRAIEAMEHGGTVDAWACMVSELNKHDETRGHPALELGMTLMIAGHLSTPVAMRKFIEDFG